MTQSEDENAEIVDPSIRESKEKYIDEESISEETLVWAPEKRFCITVAPRTENRFKSFRRS